MHPASSSPTASHLELSLCWRQVVACLCLKVKMGLTDLKLGGMGGMGCCDGHAKTVRDLAFCEALTDQAAQRSPRPSRDGAYAPSGGYAAEALSTLSVESRPCRPDLVGI